MAALRIARAGGASDGGAQWVAVHDTKSGCVYLRDFAAKGPKLRVTNVDPGWACDKAGVTTDFRVAAFQGEKLRAGATWASLRGLVKAANKPWMFVFEPCTGTPAPVGDDMGPTEAEEKAMLESFADGGIISVEVRVCLALRRRLVRWLRW